MKKYQAWHPQKKRLFRVRLIHFPIPGITSGFVSDFNFFNYPLDDIILIEDDGKINKKMISKMVLDKDK